MGRLRKFLRLPAPEKRFFIRAVILLGAYRLALSAIPLQRLLRSALQEPRLRSPQQHLAIPRIANLIKAAARLIPGATCLSNSLAGYRLFADQGYRTTIHIGVAKHTQSGFQAHAWLTIDGTIVVGALPDLQLYRELPDPRSALRT